MNRTITRAPGLMPWVGLMCVGVLMTACSNSGAVSFPDPEITVSQQDSATEAAGVEPSEPAESLSPSNPAQDEGESVSGMEMTLPAAEEASATQKQLSRDAEEFNDHPLRGRGLTEDYSELVASGVQTGGPFPVGFKPPAGWYVEKSGDSGEYLMPLPVAEAVPGKDTTIEVGQFAVLVTTDASIDGSGEVSSYSISGSAVVGAHGWLELDNSITPATVGNLYVIGVQPGTAVLSVDGVTAQVTVVPSGSGRNDAR